MKVEIHLNNGEVLVEDVAIYEKAKLLETLNNPSVVHISIGEMIVNKHSVLLVRPEVQNG